MTKSMDEVYREIAMVADLGIGRNCGRPNSDIEISFIGKLAFVDAKVASENIGSVEFENFLLSIRPKKVHFPGESYNKFMLIFNDVATMVKPYTSDISSSVSISGLDNSPQGFSLSLPASTVSWLLISYAQEHVAVSDFSYKGPEICKSLLEILKIGRLPVGFVDRPRGGELLVY